MNKSKKCNHYPRIEGKKIICLRCLKIIGKINYKKGEKISKEDEPLMPYIIK
jgi:hypothetical protein